MPPSVDNMNVLEARPQVRNGMPMHGPEGSGLVGRGKAWRDWVGSGGVDFGVAGYG